MRNNDSTIITVISKAIGEEPYYQAGISDRYIYSALTELEGLGALEWLLMREMQNIWEFVKINEGKLINFGPELKKRDLEEVLSDVKKEVDNLLDTNNCSSPSINYDSIFGKEMRLAWMLLAASCFTLPLSPLAGIPLVLASTAALVYGKKKTAMLDDKKNNFIALADYSRKYNHIRLNKKINKRVPIIPIISHEYAHHVQSYFLRENRFTKAFREGHALGIQRHISRIYAEKEDNKNFLVAGLEMDIYSILKTYLWSCKVNSKEPNQSLCGLFCRQDFKNLIDNYKKLIDIDNYSLGNSFMLLQEAVYGQEIYKKMLFDALKIKQLSSLA